MRAAEVAHESGCEDRNQLTVGRRCMAWEEDESIIYKVVVNDEERSLDLARVTKDTFRVGGGTSGKPDPKPSVLPILKRYGLTCDL